jgi:hypothetical protein
MKNRDEVGILGGGGMQPADSVTETVIGFPAGPAFGSAHVQFNENGETRDNLRLPLSLSVHFVRLSVGTFICGFSSHPNPIEQVFI